MPANRCVREERTPEAHLSAPSKSACCWRSDRSVHGVAMSRKTRISVVLSAIAPGAQGCRELQKHPAYEIVNCWCLPGREVCAWQRTGSNWAHPFFVGLKTDAMNSESWLMAARS